MLEKRFLPHAWSSAMSIERRVAAVLALAFARRIRHSRASRRPEPGVEGRREEEVLREEFGEAYESYSREVAGVVPGVW